MSEQERRTRFTVAAVQAAPVYLDLDGTVEKAVGLIAEAGARGVDLVGFPEVWIPGYPWWIWLDNPLGGVPNVARYHANSLVLGSPQAERLTRAAAEHDVNVVMGYSERDGGSRYMGQMLISRTGEVLSTRRKLKPTHVERSVFGEGDGSDLTVHETDLGRVGALCCWEHLQPLTKHAMYSLGEQIHVGAWPSCSMYPGMAYAFGPEVNAGSMRQYAVEGGCFVISSFATVSPEMIEALVDSPAKQGLLETGGGYSMVYGPDGSPLAEALEPHQEGLVVADIDLAMIDIAKSFTDPVGHYSRPDTLRLHFDRRSRRAVETLADDAPAPAPAPAPARPAEAGVNGAAPQPVDV